jgi:hypothetical protein
VPDRARLDFVYGAEHRSGWDIEILYGQVRRAVYVEGLSRREAARRFAPVVESLQPRRIIGSCRAIPPRSLTLTRPEPDSDSRPQGARLTSMQCCGIEADS